MWELDCEESWALKNWCFRTVVLEKTLERPLDCKKIQPVHPKGDQSRVFIGRTDAEAETPILLATSCEELTRWKKPWCWEGLGAGGEGENRGWDGWMASLTRWTWVWVSSRSWWWTGRPWRAVVHGVAKSRPRLSDWTELNGFQRELTETQSDCHGGIEERGRTNLGFNTYLCFCNLFHCNNVTWGQQISHNLHLFSVLTINHRPSRDNWKGTVAFGKIFFSETN